MKKIILIIFMAMISSFSYYGAVNEKGEKVVDFTNSSQQENIVTNQTIEETQENVVEQVENTIAQAETIKDEETKIQEIPKDQTTPVVEKSNKSNNTNKNKETKQTQVTQTKQDSQVKEQKETKVNKSNTTEKKEETKTNTNQNTNNTNNAPKCTHSNSNWYNSKAEAEAIYNAEIKKWSDKWTNYEIDNETYYKNCPSGYEVFSCPYCNKWTINLYH